MGSKADNLLKLGNIKTVIGNFKGENSLHIEDIDRIMLLMGNSPIHNTISKIQFCRHESGNVEQNRE